MLVDSAKNLVKIISGYFGKPENLADVNWQEIFAVSKAHNVTSIFYEAVKDRDDVPKEVLNAAKQQTLALLNQQILQEYYTEKVFVKLEEKGIKYLPLKGYIMRRYYPRPDLRSSCDSDILYDAKKEEQIAPIMQELGFLLEHEWMNGVVRIEMHTELFGRHELHYKYYDDVLGWDRLKTENKIRYDFTDEDYYIYFLAHASKHFSSAGFGIRTIMDIYVFNKEKPNLDKEYIKKELEKLGIYKFSKCLEKIADIWFNEGESDEEIKLLEEYVLTSGAYGIKEHGTVMRSSNKDKSAKGNKARYIFSMIFPSYKNMQTSYTVLRKVPILLPFVWVYRWFKVLFKRREKIGEVKKSVNLINDKNSAEIKKLLEITDFPDYNL